MRRFEEEDPEPVAVVRTLSDFALALTLVVLMLVGTKSAADSKRAAETHAATPQANGQNPELNLLMASDGKFVPLRPAGNGQLATAPALASQWATAHPGAPVTVVVQFPPQTLAKDLHGALLELESAFGKKLIRVDTVPQL